MHDVTSSLPSQVIGELVGLPEEDWPKIHHWAELNTSSQDRDLNPVGEDAERPNSIMEMAMYAIAFATQRRQEEPREDLTTLILGTEFDGELDDRHRLRHLLRAARHRRQRHHQDDAVVGAARAAATTPSSWPSCAPTRR